MSKKLDSPNLASLKLRDRYKQIFELSSDAIAIVDTQGNYLEQNEAHRKLIGYDKKTTIHFGKDVFPEIKATVNKKGTFRGELLTTKENGKQFYIELVAFPLKDDDGNITAYVGIKRDISERKKVEEELSNSKQQLEIYFKNAADGITVEDTKGRIIFANDAAVKNIGYSSVTELLNTPPQQIMDKFEMLDEKGNPFNLDKLPGSIALQGASPEAVTICFRVKETNQFHWSIVKAKAICNSQGKVTYAVNVFTDITSRMQIENALRESEERYRKLVNLSPLGIAIHQDEKVIFVNPSGANIIGAENPEELIGKSILDIVHPSYHKLVIDRMRQMVLTGKAVDLVEQKFVKLDGSLTDVEVVSIPFMYQGKLAFQAIVRDINDQKRLLQQKDDFLAISSHELKTPLTSIKAFSQLLDRYYKQNKDEIALKYLSSMISQVDRLKNLVDDLLDVSKIQTGKLIFNEEIFMFDQIVEDIIKEMQPLTKRHVIEKKGNADIRVFADKYRIGQVLTNLLTNAIKYSPYANKIIVTTSYDNGNVIVAVQDFGIGIPKKTLGKVFDKFYRVEGSKRESYPGLGLGLYISAQIMRRHNGKLWVESVEGKGTTFYFSLPITLHSRFVVENAQSSSESQYLQ